MGDLSHADASGAEWLLLALVLLVFTVCAGSLNALALGALKARALGVAVGGWQAAIYFGAAAGDGRARCCSAAASVSSA